MCEIAGQGPIPVADAWRMIDGDAFVAAVTTNGTEIDKVVHLGRKPTVLQRTALEWFSAGECSIEGCTNPARIEIDHVADWADTKITALPDLASPCGHHHDLKTRRGYTFGPRLPSGKRRLIPPDGTDPPGGGPTVQPGPTQSSSRTVTVTATSPASSTPAEPASGSETRETPGDLTPPEAMPAGRARRRGGPAVLRHLERCTSTTRCGPTRSGGAGRCGDRAAEGWALLTAKYWWASCTAMDPSPTAEATRFTEPWRTSPAANTPGMLVSSVNGPRSSGHSSAGTSAPVRT